MGRSDYEERQERRKERLEERARKAQAESDAAFNRADEIGKGIPVGQPLLVGHHSERGHRADLKRIDNAMRKSLEQRNKAEELERRAARVGTAGVSADDPHAMGKLERKLGQLEVQHRWDKAINAAWRKAGKPAPNDTERWQLVTRILELTDEEVSRLRVNAARHWYMHPQPVPAYVLKNRSAEMRRLEKRIVELKDLENAKHVSTDHGFCVVTEDPEENRLKLELDGKPEASVRKLLKREGFRWAPSVGAWQRQLNNGARHAAERVVAELTKGGQ